MGRIDGAEPISGADVALAQQPERVGAMQPEEAPSEILQTAHPDAGSDDAGIVYPRLLEVVDAPDLLGSTGNLRAMGRPELHSRGGRRSEILPREASWSVCWNTALACKAWSPDAGGLESRSNMSERSWRPWSNMSSEDCTRGRMTSGLAR